MKAEVRELVARLAALPTLAGSTSSELARLAASGRVVHLPAHWAIVQEHTPGDTCYLLLEGDATVTHAKAVVAEIHPGALFGEAGAMEHHLRNATVTTNTPVLVLSMLCSDLFAALDREPALAARLLADYRRRATAVS